MAELLRVEVICLATEGPFHRTLELPQGATVMDAIEASGIAAMPGVGRVDPQRIGIFSRRVDARQRLCDGDRVELYRPLSADPKDARRRRASRRS